MGQNIDEKTYLIEKTARESAEKILAEKSLELNLKNIELESLKNNFENLVELKTKEAVKASELANQANQAKSQFLANMSHEIRTPLTAIIGYAEILRRENPEQVLMDKYLDTIINNGCHLTDLLGEILDLSKIETQNLRLEKKRFNLVNLITELKDIHSVTAQSKSLTLSFDIDEGIPEWIVTDPTRLKQVLHNLLSNAIKFTAKGKVSFKASTNWKDNTLVFIVTDTGEGISLEQQQHIFDSFKQADASITRKYGGTGLGLSIAKSIVGLMGGQLSVESEVNKGSQFTASIKSEGIAGKTTVLPASHSQMSTSEPLFVPQLQGNVLLVEDIFINQQLITHHLELAGATVTIAENGMQAIEKAMAEEFCLVLMDIQMPVLDGKEALKGLLQLGYSKPVYSLTANMMHDDIEEYKRLGFTGTLAKPLEVAKLYEVLSKYLKSVAKKEMPEDMLTVDSSNTINDIIKPKFLLALAGQYEQLNDFYEQNEYAKIGNILHIIKGSAGSFGYNRLTEVANQVLVLIRTDKISEASKQMKNVMIQIEKILFSEKKRG
ncbi:ATP-binding protein [Paraglaciecola sp. L3A3]|uniref:ATP-binding protein n=1 Tax=Paraglaciecola sp. L3A3 TaxID=2686358 RepID=UPI00131D3F36|nr:ATP-binding protein [Paraglaciecola sp. L3A3]